MSDAARGMSFGCSWCVRPDDPLYRGPRVHEDGAPMSGPEIWEAYSARRYVHLQRDFPTTRELRIHLEDRAHYWTRDQGKEQLDAALRCIDATIEMLERRRETDLRESDRQERLLEEIA